MIIAKLFFLISSLGTFVWGRGSERGFKVRGGSLAHLQKSVVKLNNMTTLTKC